MGLLVTPFTTTPAIADPQSYERSLQWVTIDKPGLVGYMVVHPSDITDIALGGSLFYANDSKHSVLYRSWNGGLRWEDISGGLRRAGATFPVTKIAIASDQSAIIAVADSVSDLYLSVDGGVTWGDVDLNAIGTVQSIAISKPYGDSNEQRDILVGTALFGDTPILGQVWMLHMGSVAPSWKNLNITVDPSFVGGEVSSVAFSPNYTSDQAVMAIVSTGSVGVSVSYRNRTYLCIGNVDSWVAGGAKWNTASGYPNCSSYPIEIFDSVYYPNPPYSQSSGDGLGITLIESSLVLSNSFSATSTMSGARKLYCFYRVDPEPVNDTSDAYRIDDSVSPYVKTFTSSGTHRYSSVALSGNTLVAGEAAPRDTLTSIVRISIDAAAVPSPVFSYAGYPYGQGDVRLAWCSGALYCGTGHNAASVIPPAVPDESGFSISSDSGENWIQISLIDTTVVPKDVAIASSPQSIFMTSTSTSHVESVWRSSGDPVGKYWGRILVVDLPSDHIIIRISPHYRDDYTIYICEVDQAAVSVSSSLWVSNNRGNSWTKYVAPPGIIDAAVMDKKVAYLALPGGYIAKTENAGSYWKDAISSELMDIATLYLSDNNTIFIGGVIGDVSYSLDGGQNFTCIPRMLPEGSAVQVIADSGFKQNKIFYAGCGNSIYRWTIGQSNSWENIRTIDASNKVTGLASVDGILYGLWYTDNVTGGSGVERSLAPVLPIESIEWDSLTAKAGGMKFNIDPTALRYQVTPTSVILWTIDTVNNNLMMYIDCLAFSGPDLIMADNKAIDCDTATGRGKEVNFTWAAVCEDTAYQLQIGKDSNFSWMFFDSGNTWPFLIPAEPLSPALAYMGGGTLPILSDNGTLPLLECGHMYYWRVRSRAAASGDIIRSPWSEVRFFSVKPGYKVTAPYYGLLLLTPTDGCGCACESPVSFSWTPFKGTTAYKYELSLTPEMSLPLVSTTVGSTAYQYKGQLECGRSYYWRVRADQPVSSDWSAVFSLTVLPENDVQSGSVVQTGLIPRWVWLSFGLGVVLILAVTSLIMILR